jgi:hypothetical protein
MKQNRFENFNVYTRSSTRIAAVGVTALALFAASAKDGVPIIKKAVEPGIALADTLPFTDTIVTPVDGTSVSGEIEITTDPKDPLGTVISEEVYVDGIDKGSKTPGMAFGVDSTQIPNGVHVIGLEAKDNLGNTAATQEQVLVQNFPPDTQAPSESITSPVNGSTVSKNVQIITAPFDNQKVAREEVFIDGRDQGPKSPTVPFGWNTNNFPNGNHTLEVDAFDSAGNEGAASETVNVHNTVTPPPITQTPKPTEQQLESNCRSGALDAVGNVDITIQKNRRAARIEIVTNKLPQECLKLGHEAVKFSLSPALQKKLGREYVYRNGKKVRSSTFTIKDPIHPNQEQKAFYRNMYFQRKFPLLGHVDLPDRTTASWTPNGRKPDIRHNPSYAVVSYN